MSGRSDPLEGFFETAPGVKGAGLRLDGFTACLRTAEANRIVSGREITVEAWISLGEYPWNWCPILTAESDEVKGYRLMVGPLGQASLECAIGNQWIACTTARDALPLRTWIHVAGVYRADSGLTVYLNGEPAASQAVKGAITFAPRAGYVLGMVARPEKPSDIHRTHGTLPAYFGLDGILDEVKVYDAALPAERIKAEFAAVKPSAPDIAPRKLPAVDFKPGRFGAFTTKLKYYPGWDNLWPVDQDPDIVVCFKDSPVRLVFWRGTRYSPAWVSENGNWMTDQSVETWGTGDGDREGCFEHMQDRHCRFSHVRIIENTPARVVVHWRYAPVSAYNNTWNIDPKTGWELWIDEYYYIYPDASAVRKVSWKKGTLGDTFQLQETLALLHPGQAVSDLLEKDYVIVADYSGRTGGSSYVENPSAPALRPVPLGCDQALYDPAIPVQVQEQAVHLLRAGQQDVSALREPGLLRPGQRLQPFPGRAGPLRRADDTHFGQAVSLLQLPDLRAGDSRGRGPGALVRSLRHECHASQGPRRIREFVERGARARIQSGRHGLGSLRPERAVLQDRERERAPRPHRRHPARERGGPYHQSRPHHQELERRGSPHPGQRPGSRRGEDRRFGEARGSRPRGLPAHEERVAGRDPDLAR